MESTNPKIGKSGEDIAVRELTLTSELMFSFYARQENKEICAICRYQVTQTQNHLKIKWKLGPRYGGFHQMGTS